MQVLTWLVYVATPKASSHQNGSHHFLPTLCKTPETALAVWHWHQRLHSSLQQQVPFSNADQDVNLATDNSDDNSTHTDDRLAHRRVEQYVDMEDMLWLLQLTSTGQCSSDMTARATCLNTYW